MEVKTIICNKVEYADIRLIESVGNGIVTFKNVGDDFSVLRTESAILTETSSTTAAGLLVSQKLSVLANMELNVAKIFERVPTVLRLTTDKWVVQVWGDLTLKVRNKELTRNFNETRMVLQRKTTTHEF